MKPKTVSRVVSIFNGLTAPRIVAYHLGSDYRAYNEFHISVNRISVFSMRRLERIQLRSSNVQFVLSRFGLTMVMSFNNQDGV